MKIGEEKISTFKSELKVAYLTIEDFKEGYLDVERILGYCKACPRFSKSWSCPSFDFDVVEFWNAFKGIYIVARKVYIDEDVRNRKDLDLLSLSDEIYTKIKNDLTLDLLKFKKEGYTVLSGGHCNFCDRCKRLDNLPCNKKELLTYSIESLGGDVTRIINELLYEKVQWASEGRLPAYYITCGGLLTRYLEGDKEVRRMTSRIKGEM